MRRPSAATGEGRWGGTIAAEPRGEAPRGRSGDESRGGVGPGTRPTSRNRRGNEFPAGVRPKAALPVGARRPQIARREPPESASRRSERPRVRLAPDLAASGAPRVEQRGPPSASRVEQTGPECTSRRTEQPRVHPASNRRALCAPSNATPRNRPRRRRPGGSVPVRILRTGAAAARPGMSPPQHWAFRVHLTPLRLARGALERALFRLPQQRTSARRRDGRGGCRGAKDGARWAAACGHQGARKREPPGPAAAGGRRAERRRTHRRTHAVTPCPSAGCAP